MPHNQKRRAILEAAGAYRDATSYPMPVSEWASMGEMMGIANMGGPAVNILAGWQTPTLARGASMLDAMKGMDGMIHGAAGTTPGTAASLDSMAGMKMEPSKSAPPKSAPPPKPEKRQVMTDMPDMKP